MKKKDNKKEGRNEDLISKGGSWKMGGLNNIRLFCFWDVESLDINVPFEYFGVFFFFGFCSFLYSK